MVVVTPSPQPSSCELPIETIILAAGCLTISSATILAPSLVTAVVPSVLYSILSSPRGPKVGFRRSENTRAALINLSWTSVPLVTFVSGLTMTTGGLPSPSLMGSGDPRGRHECFESANRSDARSEWRISIRVGRQPESCPERL